MRTLVSKLVIGFVIAATGMFAADSMMGTWKLNVAKSTSTNANPIKSRTDVYEATPDGSVKLTRNEERADGTAYHSTFTAKYDGKEYPVADAPFDTIAMKRVNANTTTSEVRKKGGAYHQTTRHVVSKDGKTKTQTVKGTDADGKHVVAKLVYERQ
jgi:hypothetical protein